MKNYQSNHVTKHPSLWEGLGGLFAFLLPLLFTACSESASDDDEYANWQARNDQYFASLQDSLTRGGASWTRLKKYSLDPSTEGQQTDYVYVHKIEEGSVVLDSSDGTQLSSTSSPLSTPMFTDSVRVSYQGRLIPSATYPEGFVFDGTVYRHYDSATNATAKMAMAASGTEVLISGWITALMHMHRGDHWRLYIPHQLGYGSQDKSTSGIPAYSTLIFDLTLVDFSPVGQAMPAWSARKR